jgi:uncharacterized alpha-E superfamily protein
VLLSRVADALYWIGRYLERAEHTARVVDVRLDLALDRVSVAAGWNFARLYDSLQLTPPADLPTHPPQLVEALVFDAANPESVLSTVTFARENARQVREEIGTDIWEQINGLYLRLRVARAEGTWPMRPHYLSRLIIEGVHAVQGTTDATMGHGEGWQYLQVGRFLERAGATASLVDLHIKNRPLMPGASSNHIEWAGLLQSCAALEAYCRVYTADLRPDRIVEFLLLNSEFPRSVRFSADSVENALRTIAQHVAKGPGGRAERLAGRLHASLDYAQVDELIGDDLHTYLAGISRQCQQIHTALSQTYINYAIESALPA